VRRKFSKVDSTEIGELRYPCPTATAEIAHYTPLPPTYVSHSSTPVNNTVADKHRDALAIVARCP